MKFFKKIIDIIIIYIVFFMLFMFEFNGMFLEFLNYKNATIFIC